MAYTLTYTPIDDATTRLTGYTGTPDTVIIPETDGGLSVVSIGSAVFQNVLSLISVEMPAALISIGQEAFEGCTNLTTVTMGANVAYIQNQAFKGCSSLVGIEFPAVQYIGSQAFLNCTSLTELEFPEGLGQIIEMAFSGCTSIETISFNSDLQIIDYAAFRNCDSLISVVIPEGITGIDDYSFYGCDALASVTLPSGLLTIGLASFASCPSLSEITIPDGVISFGLYCFNGCTGLSEITFLGDAPTIAMPSFEDVTATAHCLSFKMGFSNPFYGLTLIVDKYTSTLFPSGYSDLSLAVWGNILGIQRPSYDDGGTPVPFSDKMYSRVLLARIMLLGMTGSMDQINRYIEFLFAGVPVEVVDNLDMTITYWFGAALTAEEEKLLDVDGILPRPAGVEAKYELYGSAPTIFGFSGQRAGVFDQSVFVEEPEYVPT